MRRWDLASLIQHSLTRHTLTVGQMLDKEAVKRKLRHAEKRLAQVTLEQSKIPEHLRNYHGGHTVGYWQGMVSALEDVLNE